MGEMWTPRPSSQGRVRDWFRDLFGSGTDTWGVGDESGAYTGFLGTGPAGTGVDQGTSYDEQVRALMDRINAMVGAGGFGALQDTAISEAQEIVGGTSYTDPVTGETRDMTAGDWSTMAGAVPQGQSFEDWAAAQGYYDATGQWIPTVELNDIGAGREGLEGLIGQVQNTALGRAEGEDFSARMRGFTTADAADTALASLRAAAEGATSDFEGLSPEDRALWERQDRLNLRDIEARETRMLQNVMGNTGSLVQMLQASDESTRRLTLVQMQQTQSLNDEEWSRQVAQHQQAVENYQFQAGAGPEGVGQFMAAQTASLNAAVQAYNVNLNSMIAENSQYLSTHQGDMAILEANATRMNNMYLMQTGLDERTLRTANELYDREVQTYRDDIALLLGTEEFRGTDAWVRLMEYYLQVGEIVIAAVL